MPRKPRADSFVVENVEVEAYTPYIAWMLIDQATAVPTRFSATCHLSVPLVIVNMDIVMEGIRPAVRRLEIINGRQNERGLVVDADGSITNTNLRQVLVDSLLRLVMEKVRHPVELLPPDASASLIRGGAMPAAVERGVATMFRVPGTPPGQFHFSPAAPSKTDRATTKSRAAEAAQHYRQAVANGSHAPGKDVALAMEVSPSQASRYLKSAREAGLLDEPKKPLSEMPPEDYARMREGTRIGELDLTRNPESD